MRTLNCFWPIVAVVFLVMTTTVSRRAIATEDTSSATAATDPSAATEAEETSPKEGHSIHGEVFNEGPRQAAYLIEGCGKVRFPVTTSNDEARKFIEQGVAQLHGFWYFESERSFRQAAVLDPDCATAYWGMAMSNRSNEKRAKGFIAEAVKRKDKVEKREQMLIEALERFINASTEEDKQKEERADRYVADLEDILIAYPDDIETKAFLCEYLWSGKRHGLHMASNLSVDAMIQQVLDVEPLHPAHHYRIHLWDSKKPELALRSAALGGLAAPSIAHMWHMPGHTYSKLHRYHDAVYQQEASARVDHSHMMRDRVLPDQIHNFAHNNEWCIRNMISIGRAHDAESLARNMLSMPRHPKYNSLEESGSFKYGRDRLINVLQSFEMYETLAALHGTTWLEDTGDADQDLRRDRALGSALAATGNYENAAVYRDRLQKLLELERQNQAAAIVEAEKKSLEAKSDEKAIEKAKKDAENKSSGKIEGYEKAVFEIDARIAAGNGDSAKALNLLTKASVSNDDLIAAMLRAGKTEEAVNKAAENVKSNPGEVRALGSQVEALHAAGKKDEAKSAFEQLRRISSTIDLDVAPMMRLAPMAEEFGYPVDWRLAHEIPTDIGTRPNLDSLGPFRWSPRQAPQWTLPDPDGKSLSLSDYQDRPVIVVYYLGYGCLHCAEQLQAISQQYDDVRNAGFKVVAISTDEQVNLKRASENLEKEFPFPLVADPEMKIFQEYRCYDDFEKAALHGTFIVDPSGRIRWQDISYEPFMDLDFLIKEGQRLISFDHTNHEPSVVTINGRESFPPRAMGSIQQ
jgi:peroxiredoxin